MPIPAPHARGRCRPPSALCLALGLLAAACAAQSAATPAAKPIANGPLDSGAQSPSPRPPDIVLIMADDLDQQLGGMDVLPKVDALLRREGLSLERHYVSFPTCCPARVSLLRGQYPHSHRVLTNAPPAGGYEKVLPLGLESSTLGTWLQEAGYRTLYAGKYLNGYPLPSAPERVPPGWSRWYAPVDEAAYGSFGYRMNENGSLVAYGQAPEDHVTDVLAAKVAADIRSGDPRPLFAVIAPFAPHAPAVPAPRHQGLFPEARVPRTASFDEADVSDKPARIQLLSPLFPEPVATMDAEYRARLQSLQAVDDLVAQVAAALEESGRLADAVLIFSSDNGYHLGQHRLPAGKTTAYEEDIRIPFLIRGPGIKAGRREARWLTGMVDLAPTIAELAGVKAPDFVEGRSLLPILLGDGQGPAEWRRAFLLEGYAGGSRSQRGTPVVSPEAGRPGYGAIAPPDAFDLSVAGPAATEQENPNPTREVYLGLRTARFTFVLNLPAEYELYDNDSDPQQLQNLARQVPPAYLEALRDWAAALHACRGAACRDLEARELPAPPSDLPPPASPQATARHDPTPTPAASESARAPATTPAAPTAAPGSPAAGPSPGASALPARRHLPLLIQRRPGRAG